MSPVRILLADDQVLFVESLRRVIESLSKDIEVVSTASNGMEAVGLVEKLVPDIVLMDVRMPVMDGVEATRVIHEKHPEVLILMLTTFDDDDYIERALRHGAIGYILKDIPPQSLVASIMAIRDGNFLASAAVAQKILKQAYRQDGQLNLHIVESAARGVEWVRLLSRREKEVLACMVDALSNREIAATLYIAEQTVKNHISAIYGKSGIKDRLKIISCIRGHVDR